MALPVWTLVGAVLSVWVSGAYALVPGLTVGPYTSVDWTAVKASGATFAYAKATEGEDFAVSQFAEQYNASRRAGLLHGAWHFARLKYDAAKQAEFFVANGGAWRPDGWTLPGVLSLSELCDNSFPNYQLARGWVDTFVARYRNLTSRTPLIMVNKNCWNVCTKDYTVRYPLFVRSYPSNGSCTKPLSLPTGFSTWQLWECQGSNGTVQAFFNGEMPALRALSCDGACPPQ